jgi:hypothetical protein
MPCGCIVFRVQIQNISLLLRWEVGSLLSSSRLQSSIMWKTRSLGPWCGRWKCLDTGVSFVSDFVIEYWDILCFPVSPMYCMLQILHVMQYMMLLSSHETVFILGIYKDLKTLCFKVIVSVLFLLCIFGQYLHLANLWHMVAYNHCYNYLLNIEKVQKPSCNVPYYNQKKKLTPTEKSFLSSGWVKWVKFDGRGKISMFEYLA